MEFAKALEAETSLRVDIYGKCGLGAVPKNNPISPLLEYKYYLSFENSLCKEYVTEKFYKVLKLPVIPIVRGARKR